MTRPIPAAMRAALQRGVTHFCHCWHIKRADGVQLGLTDHDRDISFNEISFHARAGISLSARDMRLGLTRRGQATGVLSQDLLTKTDLAAGHYDNAAFDLWLVDWQNPTNRMLLMVGQFGRVQSVDGRFSVGLAPPGGGLDAPRGRVYQKTCDAVLGDARCGVALRKSPLSYKVNLRHVTRERLTVDRLERPDGWFTHGVVETRAGRKLMIREDKQTASGHQLYLWLDASDQLTAGDSVRLTTGCDKRLSTCRDKFANAVNFKAFPICRMINYCSLWRAAIERHGQCKIAAEALSWCGTPIAIKPA